jgi:iron complex transport system ATP-binding protein
MKTENKIVLETKNLDIGYCSKKGLQYLAKNLNITAEKKKLICLLGKNGIGKSTLLKTISKTLHPLGGDVFVNTVNLKNASPQFLAKKMGLVFTERIPDGELTVFELVALGRQPYTNWLGKLSPLDLEKVHAALNMVHIASIRDKKYHELSDGQLQKVMIARALAQDTEIIILDEPTAHLDIHHTIEVFKLLHKLVESTNKTIIISTHEINLALKLGNAFWLLLEDQFISGDLNELIGTNAFEKLFSKEQILFDPRSKQFHIQP